jgi:signal peptidase II
MQYIILIAAAVAIDQILKFLVVNQIGMFNQLPVIEGFFYIHVIPNNGIAMGMLANHQSIVITGTAVIMAVIAGYIFIKRKEEKLWTLLTLSAVVAGGIGNIIDRIRLNYVIDYIDFRVWPYIFNFADICIVVGCFLLIILAFFDRGREKEHNL